MLVRSPLGEFVDIVVVRRQRKQVVFAALMEEGRDVSTQGVPSVLKKEDTVHDTVVEFAVELKTAPKVHKSVVSVWLMAVDDGANTLVVTRLHKREVIVSHMEELGDAKWMVVRSWMLGVAYVFDMVRKKCIFPLFFFLRKNIFLGGGRRCQEKDCHKLDKGGGYCVAHGRELTGKGSPSSSPQ